MHPEPLHPSKVSVYINLDCLRKPQVAIKLIRPLLPSPLLPIVFFKRFYYLAKAFLMDNG